MMGFLAAIEREPGFRREPQIGRSAQRAACLYPITAV
jgi:hypothetical protein